MVLSLKRSTAGAFLVPLRILSQKKIRQEIMCCFTKGVKIISSHADKTGSWNFLGAPVRGCVYF